jgi:type VI protein secretion system component VasF
MEELLTPVFRALGAVLHGLSSVLDVLSATTTKTGSKRTDNILRYLLWVLLAILVITFMVSFLT